MTLYKPRVYTASKLPERQIWRSMKHDSDWNFVEWTATWIEDPIVEMELSGQQPEWELLRSSWALNIRDVLSSDFILLYGRTEPLRGALIECGAAIAAGIHVVAVALDEKHTWSFHPMVHRFDTFRDARTFLYKFTTMAPPNKRKRHDNPDQNI